MNIKSIKLVNSGFKGAEVTYLKEEVKNGRSVVNEIKEKRRHPVHLGLEIPFKDLRYHLLHICELLGDEDEKGRVDRVMESCEVIEVKVEPGYFVIKGEKEVFVSDKKVKLESPKVEEDDCYEYYEAVGKIIEKIIEETILYMKGEVKVSDDEVVIRWIGAGKSKEFDRDGFDALSAEERKAVCQDILEREFGAAVLMDDEMVVGEDDVESGDVINLGDMDKIMISA